MNEMHSILELLKMAQEGHPYQPNYPRKEDENDKNGKPIMHEPMIVYRPIGM